MQRLPEPAKSPVNLDTFLRHIAYFLVGTYAYNCANRFPPRLMMLEKGVHDKFDEEILNMMNDGDQKSWKHAKLNPWGKHLSLLRIIRGNGIADLATAS